MAITQEAVAQYPYPGLTQPVNWRFSPDGTLLSCLYSPEQTLSRQLFGVNNPLLAPGGDGSALLPSASFPLLASPSTGTTDSNITLAEALRRERARQLGQGITDYQWSPLVGGGDGGAGCSGERSTSTGELQLLLPLRGSLYLQSARPCREGAAALGELRLLYDGAEEPALDPSFSPDGRWVAFVRADELCVVGTSGEGAPEVTQVTHGAREAGKTHGLAEFVAQEEMDRHQGYWWAPDSSALAFAEVDEAHIPAYRITHQGKEEVGTAAQEDHRYPFAGAANATVRMGVVPRAGGEPLWIDLDGADEVGGKHEWEYLARVCWVPAGLVVQLQDRAQSVLRVLLCCPSTGRASPLLTERSAVWINLHELFAVVPATSPDGPSPGFVWGSERSGFMHLYLYDWTGALLRPLTAGDWQVCSLAAVTPSALYFSATKDSPLETHLYALPLADPAAAPRRLTRARGTHAVVLSAAHGCFVDAHSALDTPPTVRLCSLRDGSPLANLFDPVDPRLRLLSLRPPRLVQIDADPSAPSLHGALYLPVDVPAQPLPLIVYCYGGPHVQLVADAWNCTASLRVQYFRQLGFAVFVLDGRGSSRRGVAFEGAVKGNLGDLEVRDQEAGVRWLVGQGIADPARVGIYGWSYGGYLSAMCLCRAPDTFHVAVSGAPVTHWAKYDTHYTERYMGLPSANAAGYEVSSVMRHVSTLQGRLLLIHGLIDENVHFRHTAALLNALIQHRKHYDLLLFPDERHSPRKLEDRVYMEQRITAYMVEHLRLNQN